MTPGTAISTCLRKPANFLDRASRAEFWWFAPPWLAAAYIVSEAILPSPTGTGTLMVNFLIRTVFCLPVLSAAARRAADAGFDLRWIGYGFAAILTGLGLFELARTALSGAEVGWLPPVGGMMIVAALLVLTYILSRPPKPVANMREVLK